MHTNDLHKSASDRKRSKIHWAPWLLLFGFLAAGCLPVSLEPLYTESDLILDKSLVGNWTSDQGKESWTFEETEEEKVYLLRHIDNEKRGAAFAARLVVLGKHRFLDLYPAEIDAELNWLAGCQLIPGHVFFRLSISGDGMQLIPMSLEWLNEHIEKDPEAIRHKRIEEDGDDRILFTASTAELQKFVLKHADDTAAFDPESALELQRPDSE